MKTTYSGILHIILIFLSSVTHSAENITIKLFNASDYKEIINQQNNEFVMLFWSIECSPCLKEMRAISKLNKKERNRFVFIATDGHELQKEISNTIHSMDLEGEQNWVFNSNSTEEIINTIDNSWYGETPRSYYFDKEKIRRLLVNR